MNNEVTCRAGSTEFCETNPQLSWGAGITGYYHSRVFDSHMHSHIHILCHPISCTVAYTSRIDSCNCSLTTPRELHCTHNLWLYCTLTFTNWSQKGEFWFQSVFPNSEPGVEIKRALGTIALQIWWGPTKCFNILWVQEPKWSLKMLAHFNIWCLKVSY